MLIVTSARSDDVIATVVGDGRTVLEHAYFRGRWDVVCFAPCRAAVKRDGWYRLVGERRTKPITLPADAIEVTFGADAHDDYAGLLVAGIGLVTLVSGGATAGIGAFDPTDGAMAILIAGSALAGVGFIALVVGLLYNYELKPTRLVPVDPSPPKLERCESQASMLGVTIPF